MCSALLHNQSVSWCFCPGTIYTSTSNLTNGNASWWSRSRHTHLLLLYDENESLRIMPYEAEQPKRADFKRKCVCIAIRLGLRSDLFGSSDLPNKVIEGSWMWLDVVLPVTNRTKLIEQCERYASILFRTNEKRHNCFRTLYRINVRSL